MSPEGPFRVTEGMPPDQVKALNALWRMVWAIRQMTGVGVDWQGDVPSINPPSRQWVGMVRASEVLSVSPPVVVTERNWEQVTHANNEVPGTGASIVGPYTAFMGLQQSPFPRTPELAPTSPIGAIPIDQYPLMHAAGYRVPPRAAGVAVEDPNTGRAVTDGDMHFQALLYDRGDFAASGTPPVGSGLYVNVRPFALIPPYLTDNATPTTLKARFFVNGDTDPTEWNVESSFVTSSTALGLAWPDIISNGQGAGQPFLFMPAPTIAAQNRAGMFNARDQSVSGRKAVYGSWQGIWDSTRIPDLGSGCTTYTPFFWTGRLKGGTTPAGALSVVYLSNTSPHSKQAAPGTVGAGETYSSTVSGHVAGLWNAVPSSPPYNVPWVTWFMYGGDPVVAAGHPGLMNGSGKPKFAVVRPVSSDNDDHVVHPGKDNISIVTDGTTYTVEGGIVIDSTGNTVHYVTSVNGSSGAVTFTYVASVNGATGAITAVNTFNGRSGAVTLVSGDVTAALGFTPVSMTDVDSEIAAVVTAGYVDSLYGYTPADPANVVPNTRAVNTGTGLTGGGPLSGDLTLELEDYGPGAGNYDFSSYTGVTIDAKGRVQAFY